MSEKNNIQMIPRTTQRTRRKRQEIELDERPHRDEALWNLVVGVQRYLEERAQGDSQLHDLQYKLHSYTRNQALD
ncbi:hypothetical protein G6F56_014302 [Rhizopus delemar]|nr:hypothetical protein G6F56_014302 [Rhizopus delemar]